VGQAIGGGRPIGNRPQVGNPPYITKIFVASLVLLQAAIGQTASLLVRTDLECRWSVDGESKGILSIGDGVRVSLTLGEHRIEAVPVAGGPHWEDTVDLDEPAGKVLTIALKAAVAFAETQSRGYWIDPNSKLMWAAADNGSGVTQSQAAYYCRLLTLSGYKDWTLPSIEDLRNHSRFDIKKWSGIPYCGPSATDCTRLRLQRWLSSAGHSAY